MRQLPRRSHPAARIYDLISGNQRQAAESALDRLIDIDFSMLTR